ncbi:hypothetical protein BDN70DRAFT_903625 [Pholiota conissans]|uniref:DUF1279 domain-containing protein n=1 Tax=Pholiota conissans TaxID=109636 RepID=A0A9P5ZC62_9AGAR|nr:hypothetical protein BDN70DRAFT_903625 [Pholiota conissans]
MRGILPRLHIFKAIAPRVARPLLPLTAAVRPAVSPLTHTPRTHARLFSNFPARLMADSGAHSPSEPPHNPLPPDASMSQRLKHLIKSYGWYALGIYLIVGALDFTVAFIGINLLGADYVSHAAATVKDTVMDFVYTRPVEPGRDELDPVGQTQAASGKEGLYAMIVLAYTIHKTLFLPLRVGLTAAFTPKIVNWLSARGWAGSAGTRRAAHEMRERIRERGRKGNSP